MRRFPQWAGQDAWHSRRPATALELSGLLGGWIEVLDEENLVALFVVDKLVDEIFCEQKAEAAGPKALCFANGEVAEEIAGRAVDGGVAKLFERETFAGILDAAGDSVAAADEGNLHVLAGIEVAAMLHGVQENFAESRNDVFGDVGVSDSAKELHQAIRGADVAAGRDAHPFGGGGKDFDAVVPAGCGHGLADHVDESGVLERTGEVTESVFAHGADDVAGCELVGKDNKAEVRATGSNFVKNLEVFSGASFSAGDDQVEGTARSEGEDGFVVWDALDAPAFTGEDRVEELVDLRARIDEEGGSLRSRSGSR